MPGGAYFSAPLVEQAAQGTGLDNSTKATINYWFRHVWEFTWFLYPTIPWISQTYDVSLGKLILWGTPFTLAACLSGYFILLRSLPHTKGKRFQPQKDKLRLLFQSTWPLILLLGLFAVLETLLGWWDKQSGFVLPKNSGLVLALLICLIWQIRKNKFQLRQIGQTFFNPTNRKLFLIILGVMIFQQFLIKSQMANKLATTFSDLGIPLLALILILPMLVGIIVGYSLSVISASLPIVLATASQMGSSIPLPALLMAAWVAGFYGCMLSPAHSCFPLTREYFQAKWDIMYRQLILCILPVLGVALGWLVLGNL